MKKFFLLTLVFFIIIFFLFQGKAYAVSWDDCPYGNVNDEYPGECSRYIDTDNDGICDHSQPPPEERKNDFYVGKVMQATYFTNVTLPLTMARSETCLREGREIVEMPEKAF